MDPEKRREVILDAAFRAARAHGLAHLTREQVAKVADVSPGLVSARLGSMEDLKRAVRDLANRRRVDFADTHEPNGEWEWLRGRLSPSIRYRLIVNGELGIAELTRLIEQLEAQRTALAPPGK